MTPAQAAEAAGVLTGLRQAFLTCRHSIHPATAELLLWVAAGCDHRILLSEQMGMDHRKVHQLLMGLMGRRVKSKQDGWLDSPVALVTRRPHPHRAGWQWLLSPDGEAFLSHTPNSQSPDA